MTPSPPSPLGNPITLIRLAVMSVLAAVLAYTWADPDLWGHVLFGGDIIREGAIPRVDPYSFTSDKPWVNHEWLTEVTMYAAYATAGMFGLIGLKVGIVGCATALVIRSLRQAQIPWVAQDVLLFVAVAGANARLSAVRPQLYSVLLFAVLLALLVGTDRGRRAWLLGLPVVMMVWVNFHGGWLVGLGTIGLWGAFRVFQPPAGVNRGVLIAALLSAPVVTLLNPYGVGLWEFLASTVRLGRPDIEEWRPIVAFPRLLIPWGLAWLLTVVAVYRFRAQLPWAYLAIAGSLGLASYRVSRLDAFFVFAVAMLLGPLIGRLWAHSSRATPGPEPSPAAVRAISGVAWAVIAGAGVATALNLSCIRMNDDGLPEPGAAAFILHNDLHGRMVTWFDWGEYAIWHFAPQIEVSIDGRRETIYTNARIQEHLDFYFNRPGAGAFPDELKADYVWLPKALPVVPTLLNAGWKPIYEGEVSIVLAEQVRHELVQPAPVSEGRRCFPGI